jgi:hypothetical protein
MAEHKCSCAPCMGIKGYGSVCLVDLQLAGWRAEEDQRKALVRAFFDRIFGPGWVN